MDAVELTPGYDAPDEIRALFTEYTDMLPCLEDAVRMYRKLGFRDIPCYNDSPMDTTLFLGLDL